MDKLNSIEDINRVITNGKIVVIYVTSSKCSVCSVIKPKLDDIINTMPKIEGYEISIDEVSTIAGELSIFTLPAILVFIEGQEVIREARFISLDILEAKLKRYYEMLY
ncbi:thioredoxin family protein [Clostridium sp. DL1XJH146]